MPEVVRTVGRYGILREVGRGGMGVVHLARQGDLDRLVALKELAAFRAAEPDIVRRFVRESQLAGSIQHANVVTVFDYFEHDGTPFIAMEYLQRGSLRPYVGRMALGQVGGVLECVLAGLTAAEERGIVHRDLKPENLMVTRDGSVKIADFGIAKAMQGSRTSAFMTATGATIGTPAYMAPEQAMARDIGPWTDLYAVGCIAYELFTGAPPFHDADTPMAMMLRHISEPLPSVHEVAGVDQDVSDWVEALTAKDFTARPGSSSVASEQLEEILLDKLGARWRRESRLGDPPARSAAPAPSTPATSVFESFVWKDAAAPTSPQTREILEGIEVAGTGPDTPDALTKAPGAEAAGPAPAARSNTSAPAGAPTALTAVPSDRSTPAAPTTPMAGAVTAETIAHSGAPEAAPAGPGAPRWSVPLALAGAVGVGAGLVLPFLASGETTWNLFAAFSPVEAAGTSIAALIVASRLKRGLDPPLAAGLLVGFGAATVAGAVAVRRFTTAWVEGAAVPLSVVVLAAGVALLAAGLACVRRPTAQEPADAGTLMLGLAGTALVCVALFVSYDSAYSLWDEVLDETVAEYFLEPAVIAAIMLAGVALAGAWRPFGAGLLIAAGTAGTLYFVGVLIAAAGAAGEPGDVGPGGFIGALGGLLVVAAGALAASLRRR